MNNMTAAFDKAGIHPRDAAFNVAIAKYLNSGGDYNGAQALLDAARLMSGDGPPRHASEEAVPGLPSSRQPIPRQARPALSDEDQAMRASPGKPLESPDRDGGGQTRVDSTVPSISAPSVREPSVAQRAAALSVAKVSIMDTLKIDGRSYRDWGLSEAQRVGRAKTRDGYILSASVKWARQRYANLKGSEKLGDLITEKRLQRIHQKAAEVADAA